MFNFKVLSKVTSISVFALMVGLNTGCQSLGGKSASNKDDGNTGGYGRLVRPDLKPSDIRGGTTTGKPVTIDKTPQEAFKKIQAAKTKKEKDRQAILAQVGDYKVSFEFVETQVFDLTKEKDKPYFSWATEYIFPLTVSENFISLQHILVMQMLDKKGKEQEPYVVKHWRQDWTYEPKEVVEFLGHRTWKKRSLTPAESKGAWSQFVYQVDDSPRYQVVGKWSHNNSFSAWETEYAGRPLPRREHTHRSDYDVLETKHRVTITPIGWVHEQESLKKVVDPKTFELVSYLSKETGFNAYDRIKDFDFSKGKEYWTVTQDYWKEVREQWDKVLKEKKMFSLKPEVNGKKLFEEHFGFANKMVEEPKANNDYKSHAVNTINSFVK